MTIKINKLYQFIKKEAVLCIAGLASILTMFFVPPSFHYLTYIDFRVLSLLFCLMAVVAGLDKTGFFLLLSEKLLKRTGNTRSLCFILIMLCFFTSMWITNDVALITFVPFAIMLLTLTGQNKYIIYVIVLQTVAANLGSMLTPVGNPQNLYLFTYYSIPIMKFFIITFPVTLISFLLLSLSTLLIKKEDLIFSLPDKYSFRKGKTSDPKMYLYFYSILFLLCLTCVLHLVDYRFMLIVVFISILLFDRTVLKRIDYMLLLTFVFFFLFVGNLGNIPGIKASLASLLNNKTFFVSIILSQGISNVPAAVLISSFTGNYKDVILGTNIGGLGTLVASLASLISYKLYIQSDHAKPGNYLVVFTLVNVIFLSLLCIIFNFI